MSNINQEKLHNDSLEENPLPQDVTGVKCPICYTVVPPDGALILHECRHAFCLSCFRYYVKIRVGEGGAASITCPMPASECGKCVQQDELRTVLGKSAYEKLAHHALQSAINADPSLHHCLTPDCPFVVCWIYGEPPLLSCPLCKKSSCLCCKISPFHEGMTCAQYKASQQKKVKKVRLLLCLCLSWMKVFPEKGERAKERVACSREFKKTRICKQCGAHIIKESGCNKVKCRCGYRFCYVCGIENAQCFHTPRSHGYVDNVTGRADFRSLYSSLSPHA